jgi:hypothetical protein
MISDCHLGVIQPLTIIRAGIDINLKEIPRSMKMMMIKVNEIKKEMTENHNAQIE